MYFHVISKLGKDIEVSAARWDLIVRTKHPEIKGKESGIKETLKEPDEIRVSLSDPSVYLYYKSQGKYSMVVVAKHKNGEGFIITAYFTDRIKEGKQVYRREP